MLARIARRPDTQQELMQCGLIVFTQRWQVGCHPCLLRRKPDQTVLVADQIANDGDVVQDMTAVVTAEIPFSSSVRRGAPLQP